VHVDPFMFAGEVGLLRDDVVCDAQLALDLFQILDVHP
jgi:hypothetical protein